MAFSPRKLPQLTVTAYLLSPGSVLAPSAMADRGALERLFDLSLQRGDLTLQRGNAAGKIGRQGRTRSVPVCAARLAAELMPASV